MRHEPPVSVPIAAQRHPVGNRDRRPRRTPARDAPGALPVPRPARRAVMRVEAKPGIGKLRHVGPPDRHETRSQQPRDHRRVCRRWRCVRERARPGRRDLARDVEQVLQTDRDAGIARRRPSGPTQRVDGVGLPPRRLGIDADEGAAALARRIGDAAETVLHQRAGGGGSGRERVGGGFERVHRATLPRAHDCCNLAVLQRSSTLASQAARKERPDVVEHSRPAGRSRPRGAAARLPQAAHNRGRGRRRRCDRVAADRQHEPLRRRARRRRADRRRPRQARTRAADRRRLARQADLRRPPHPAGDRLAAEPAGAEAAERPQLACASAADLCRELAPLDQAGIRDHGRHLHPSRLHPELFPGAECDRPAAELAGRVFLPVPRLEIRSRRPRLVRRAGALQPPRPALQSDDRDHRADRAEPDRGNLQPQVRSCRSRPAAGPAHASDPGPGRGDPAARGRRLHRRFTPRFTPLPGGPRRPTCCPTPTRSRTGWRSAI